MPLNCLASYRILGGTPLRTAICGLMKTANQSPQITRVPSERLLKIGETDDPPIGEEGPMIETVGTRLEGEEVDLLGDLLEKMLKYNPEERITIQEVVRHPWFEYTPRQYASSLSDSSN